MRCVWWLIDSVVTTLLMDNGGLCSYLEDVLMAKRHPVSNQAMFCVSLLIYSAALLSPSVSGTLLYTKRWLWYNTISFTCDQQLAGNQLSLPHGTKQKNNKKSEIKPMNMISPVYFDNLWRQSGEAEVYQSLLWWEGFLEKVHFQLGMKEWGSSGCWE